MLGRVEDPASELSNGDVYMTNSKRDSTRNQTSSQNDDLRRYMLNVKYLAVLLCVEIIETRVHVHVVSQLMTN